MGITKGLVEGVPAQSIWQYNPRKFRESKIFPGELIAANTNVTLMC